MLEWEVVSLEFLIVKGCLDEGVEAGHVVDVAALRVEDDLSLLECSLQLFLLL